MRTTYLKILLLTFIIMSCNAQKEKKENKFNYCIQGVVENGDSSYISLYIPSQGLDARQTTQIIDGKYEFKGSIEHEESAFIRFDNDIVNNADLYCVGHLFIEKDTIVFNFNIDTTDFGLCFKDLRYLKGDNNLYYRSVAKIFNQKPTWIFSDPYLKDSMHKFVYPDIKKYMIDTYKEHCLYDTHQIVSLFYLNHMLNDRRSIFDPEFLTFEEIEAFELFFSNIDPSLYQTQMYINLQNNIEKLTGTRKSFFKNFKLLNVIDDSTDLKNIISKHRTTIVYFWWSGCQPCRKTIKEMTDKYSLLRTNDIEIVTINTDQSKKLWKEISKKDSIEWVNLYAGDNSNVVSYYDIHYYPFIMIFDNKLNLKSIKYKDLKEILNK